MSLTAYSPARPQYPRSKTKSQHPRPRYPTSQIQKGILLEYGGVDLSEEGTGFGVPVLKFGQEAVFPGSWNAAVERDGDYLILRAEYFLNLVSRMKCMGFGLKSPAFYDIRERLSSIHRSCPNLRNLITSSSKGLRHILCLEDTFMPVPAAGFVQAVYKICEGKILVELKIFNEERCAGFDNKCTEIVVLNEQGANYFDAYRDSDGRFLKNEAIGSWDEVFAEEASLMDSIHRIGFTLTKVKGARMFRGREIMDKRLAWSGLAYVFPPHTENIAYSITLGGI